MAEKVKPRFDGKEPDGFANLHRLLPRENLMFDVDRLFVNINIDLSMRNENQLYTEYCFKQSKVVFKAIFEVKYKPSKSSEESLDKYTANSIARLEMAKRLDCRLFIVIQNNGKKPFDFFEIDTNTGDYSFIGTLDYQQGHAKEAFNKFWYDVLRLL